MPTMVDLMAHRNCAFMYFGREWHKTSSVPLNYSSHLALCVGFALPVEFLNVFREALEIWNHKLVPECS